MAFVGIRLDKQVISSFNLKPLRDSFPRLEWSHTGDLHLTLRFFPERKPEDLAQLLSTLPSFTSPVEPFVLEIKGAGTFDRDHKGGVLWLGLKTIPAALCSLQQELELFAQKLGYLPEPRSFNPHITIARYRAVNRADATAVIAEIERNPTFRQSVDVREIALMKRANTDEGVRYSDLLIHSLSLT